MYVISEKGLKQQEQLMGPQEELTATGIHISYRATAGKQHIAWKSWRPDQRHIHPALLCIPGAHLGLEIYEPLAFWLAEQGVQCHALSLANHGVGWGYSWDMELRSEGSVTLHHATQYIGRVVDELKDMAVLVGAGLGGIAAQIYAQQHPDQVAGLILLGSCLPSLAAGVWPSPLPVPTLIAHLLGQSASERDVETLATLLDPETVLIEPSALESWSGEPIGPTLVLAGEHDPYVLPPIFRATAAHYKTEAHIINDAAHLLTWGKHWLVCAEYILAFLHEASLAN